MHEKIAELLKITNATAETEKFISYILDQLAKGLGDDDPHFVAAIIAGLKAAVVNRIDELIDNTAMIYEKYYNEADIDAMLAFHKSPVGQKIREVSTQIQAETSAFGEAWGQDIVQKLASEMDRLDNLSQPKVSSPALVIKLASR